MPKHTIYALIDPRNDVVRYIGMTATPLGHRLYLHLTNERGKRTKKTEWIRELQQADLQPNIQALEENIENAQQAGRRERHWIHHYLDSGAPLTNTRKAKVYQQGPALPTEWVSIADAARHL